MGISSLIARMDRHADLFDRMLMTLGLWDRMRELKNVGPVYRRATMRCVGCSGADACTAWMDQHDHATSPPEYCRNAGLLARLSKDLPDQSKPARS